MLHERIHMTPEIQSGAALPSPPAHPSDEDFLRLLGIRVRELRSRRGMTRKMVARESDVSERHLAQLELGDGNVSIVLLRRIATALNVLLADLFTAEAPDSDAKRSIQKLLDRLPAQQLNAVVARLVQEFGAAPQDRRSRIALIGLRGAGKSTLGVKLAQAVKAPFIELDREIAKEAGMDLAEIFSLYGQSGYRRIEQRVLERDSSGISARGAVGRRRRGLRKRNLRPAAGELFHGVGESESGRLYGEGDGAGRFSGDGRKR